MAAKLILSLDGVVQHEYDLNKERMTIGRKPHNDVVIDNLAVSGEHAAIVTILNDSFLEDLNSTNGVVVNGVAIKKHFLQANDIIEIGKYQIMYANQRPMQPSASEDSDKTMLLRPPVLQSQAGSPETPTPYNPSPPAKPAVEAASTAPPAALQILSGSNAGKELDLVKSLTTLGKPGVQVAVLTRRPHGYFITHVEGANYPSLNGEVLDEKAHQLNNHDIIELAGIKMEFYLKN